MEQDEMVEETITSEEQDSDPQIEKESQLSEKEKAAHNLKKQAERLKAAGGDPALELGIPSKEETQETATDADFEEKTLAVLRKVQKQESRKTSLELAEEIEDDAERQEVKKVLARLDPSNDPRSDIALARSAANAARTYRVAQEQSRKTEAKRTAAGSSSPAEQQEEEFTPTPQEEQFMKSFGLSKEKILAARRKE